MATKQTITKADEVFVGNAFDRRLQTLRGRHRGKPVHFLTKVSLGAPILGDADYLVAAATSTELPNNTTTTYTTTNDGTTPFDNVATPVPATVTMLSGASASVWALDVPRNLVATVTHASSVVAMTVTVTGYDEYKVKLTETLTITATGTSKTAAGKKAFAYVESISITSAGNATTNTLNLGVGDVLGLPYKLASKADCLGVWFDDAADAATLAVAVSTTATATTGDVRGTVDLAGTLDGTKVAVVWMHVPDFRLASEVLGVDQYAA